MLQHFHHSFQAKACVTANASAVVQVAGRQPRQRACAPLPCHQLLSVSTCSQNMGSTKPGHFSLHSDALSFRCHTCWKFISHLQPLFCDSSEPRRLDGSSAGHAYLQTQRPCARKACGLPVCSLCCMSYCHCGLAHLARLQALCCLNSRLGVEVCFFECEHHTC